MIGRRTVLASGAVASLLPTGRARSQTARRPPKIGVLTDMTSLYADFSGPGSVVAARMAVEEFQAAHPGQAPEIVFADHLNKADVGASITRSWFDREGVDAVADVPNSAVALAVNGIVRDKNKVFLISGASSSDLTGKMCSPNSVAWAYDTYMLSAGTAKGVLSTGGHTWFDIVADYAFGHSMQRDVAALVEGSGGKMISAVLAPLGTADFSAFLLEAQASKAEVVGLINAGGDTINSIKQAAEFGISASGQQLVALVLYITDVHALGLEVARGLRFTTGFYWNLNAATAGWGKRFAARNGGKFPTQVQAGVYSAVLHYLKAAAETGTVEDGRAVVTAMKAMPTDDQAFGRCYVRQDGRMMHDVFLCQVKKPSELTQPWDYYNIVRTIPAAQAWRPLAEGGCSLVRL
jgi:branched-chain amino acid transport system substrate-binding protein